ncbi:hypothetical protein Trydic_g2468 [Trypoxylus dichotomus]
MNSETGQIGKEFDLSFTIPRKKEEDPEETEHSSILADVYGSPADTPSNMYSSPVSTAVANHVVSSLEQAWSQLDSSTSSLKRSWHDANANMTCPNKRYKETFTELHDSTLPAGLLSLFQPLFCKLCMFQLSGNSMAKMHYKSKNHDKKIRAWLIEHAEKTGQPLHPRAVLPRIKKDDQELDPKYYYCSVCDLPLTGKMHAESHYMGKNHIKAAYGKKTPAGVGYYNGEGKWTRITKKEATGYDSIGHDFAGKDSKPHGSSQWRCEICQVTVTSAGQLEIHERGSKHTKKLKALQEGISSSQASPDGTNETEASAEHLPRSANSDLLSAYRTPSGQFYCEICNMSMNSEMQFTQHLLSKKHSKKAATSTAHSIKISTASVVGSSDDIFDHL